MFKALNVFLTTLFTGCNSFARAFSHAGAWADESMGAFADEARVTRQAQINDLNKALKLTAK